MKRLSNKRKHVRVIYKNDLQLAVQAFSLGAIVCVCIVCWLYKGDNIASTSVIDLLVPCCLDIFLTVTIAWYAVKRFEIKRGVFTTAEHFVERMERDIDSICVQINESIKKRQPVAEVLPSTLVDLYDIAEALYTILKEANFKNGATEIAYLIVDRLAICCDDSTIQSKEKQVNIGRQEALRISLLHIKVKLMTLLALMHRY